MIGEQPIDSPVVTRPVCPGCEPDTELHGMVEVRWCHHHEPKRTGTHDGAIPRDLEDSYPAGSAEAGGSENRAFCAFFHRGRK